jgi:hypothetical protein
MVDPGEQMMSFTPPEQAITCDNPVVNHAPVLSSGIGPTPTGITA